MFIFLTSFLHLSVLAVSQHSDTTHMHTTFCGTYKCDHNVCFVTCVFLIIICLGHLSMSVNLTYMTLKPLCFSNYRDNNAHCKKHLYHNIKIQLRASPMVLFPPKDDNIYAPVYRLPHFSTHQYFWCSCNMLLCRDGGTYLQGLHWFRHLICFMAATNISLLRDDATNIFEPILGLG